MDKSWHIFHMNSNMVNYISNVGVNNTVKSNIRSMRCIINFQLYHSINILFIKPRHRGVIIDKTDLCNEYLKVLKVIGMFILRLCWSSHGFNVLQITSIWCYSRGVSWYIFIYAVVLDILVCYNIQIVIMNNHIRVVVINNKLPAPKFYKRNSVEQGNKN